jgi:hypothetical protein
LSVSLGALGAVALLGTLSLAVILAQVVALVLLGFAPVALVIGIFPSAGDDLFRGWLGKLASRDRSWHSRTRSRRALCSSSRWPRGSG